MTSPIGTPVRAQIEWSEPSGLGTRHSAVDVTFPSSDGSYSLFRTGARHEVARHGIRNQFHGESKAWRPVAHAPAIAATPTGFSAGGVSAERRALVETLQTELLTFAEKKSHSPSLVVDSKLGVGKNMARITLNYAATPEHVATSTTFSAPIRRLPQAMENVFIAARALAHV